MKCYSYGKREVETCNNVWVKSALLAPVHGVVPCTREQVHVKSRCGSLLTRVSCHGLLCGDLRDRVPGSRLDREIILVAAADIESITIIL